MSPKYILCFLILIASAPAAVNAHPGGTASDGCHYCRTNCDKWGVQWNVRHCHGTSQSSFIDVSTTIEAPADVETNRSSIKPVRLLVPETIVPSQ